MALLWNGTPAMACAAGLQRFFQVQVQVVDQACVTQVRRRDHHQIAVVDLAGRRVTAWRTSR
jgi:hypothetical protein